MGFASSVKLIAFGLAPPPLGVFRGRRGLDRHKIAVTAKRRSQQHWAVVVVNGA